MRKTGFLYDDRYLLHTTGPSHPEVGQRLIRIYEGIEEGGLVDKLVRILAEPADLKWIELVHTLEYIDKFKNESLSGAEFFGDLDNHMCSDTYDVALLAVGGILKAVSMVMKGEIDNAFCAVRPPGHHAEVDRAMGFCYFNNVAIAARFLQHEFKVKKVAIIDFDVHHGNGTQHIFEKDPTVFFYSIHQHPDTEYPGTGYETEIGLELGLGFTKNSPVMPGAGTKEYVDLIRSECIPALREFHPEVIIISAGFDAHQDDGISDTTLSVEGFSQMFESIVEMAGEVSNGRVISVLEGGYCLHRLGELAKNHVEILLG